MSIYMKLIGVNIRQDFCHFRGIIFSRRLNCQFRVIYQDICSFENFPAPTIALEGFLSENMPQE